MSAHYEIERKYLVVKPDFPLPCPDWVSRIEQVYLKSPKGTTDRIRSRDGKFSRTRKKPVSDMTAEESESAITREEYNALLADRDESLAVIHKTRHVFSYKGQIFELDDFDFWEKQAMLEIELKGENAVVELPPFLQLVREVTHDIAYKNKMMAKNIPAEDLL